MSGSYDSEDDPTRRIPLDPERRQRPESEWRDERTSAARDDPQRPDGRPPRRRGRGVGIWLFGAVIGFVIAFIVVALGGSDPGDGASDARVEALEADLEDRDARIAELEASLAEAEAAAGERDEDVQAQRDALDERADALDQRANALDEREAAVDRRESDLAERERGVEEEPSDDDGGELPGIDEDTVDSIVDRVLEQLRDLFGD